MWYDTVELYSGFSMSARIKEEYLSERIYSDRSKYFDLLEFPTHFEIETINACNARCPMCTINEWNKEEKMMSEILFNKIVDELSEYSSTIKRVNLYRDGEPLLDLKLEQRIKLLKSKKIKEIAISTNCSLLTESRSKELLESGLDMITMSIDSLDKSTYEAIRVNLNFEKSINNVKNFLRGRNELGSNCKVWIRMIRQKSNIDEFDQYEKYWLETGLLNTSLDRVYYHNIFNWGGQLNGFDGISENTEKLLPCVALWSLMPIFANGDVPMCNVDFNCNHKMGNLFESSIKEIWTSRKFSDARDSHMNSRKSDYQMCVNCNVWEEVPPKGATTTVSSQYARLLTPLPTSS